MPGMFFSVYIQHFELSLVNELVSHLPLQMLLYFNLFYFPCWWFSAVFMLEVKVRSFGGVYAKLCTIYICTILVSDCSIFKPPSRTRLCLFPLCHQVPALAAFWLLSLSFQLPVLLFFVTDEGIIILPLERAIHSIFLIFLLAQILASFLALRTMTRKLTLLFHMRQFGKVENNQRVALHRCNRSPDCISFLQVIYLVPCWVWCLSSSS
uniref:Zgc:112294 n=1 Tax=Fundulus heteroclitus TaxID=8078 RepID=A0A3Q2P8V1_FUNHE